MSGPMKTCSLCGETKPVGMFHLRGEKPGARRGRCKACEAAAQRLQRERDADNLRARDRVHREKYREQRTEYSRAYYAANREACLEKQRLRRAANPERRREARLGRIALILWREAKRRAQKRGIEFDLEPTDVVVPAVCPVFGMPLVIADGRMDAASPTLDRMDSTRGYVRGNVAVISWRANCLKRDGSLAEFVRLVEWMRSNG